MRLSVSICTGHWYCLLPALYLETFTNRIWWAYCYICEQLLRPCAGDVTLKSVFYSVAEIAIVQYIRVRHERGVGKSQLPKVNRHRNVLESCLFNQKCDLASAGRMVNNHDVPCISKYFYIT